MVPGTAAPSFSFYAAERSPAYRRSGAMVKTATLASVIVNGISLSSHIPRALKMIFVALCLALRTKVDSWKKVGNINYDFFGKVVNGIISPINGRQVMGSNSLLVAMVRSDQ